MADGFEKSPAPGEDFASTIKGPNYATYLKVDELLSLQQPLSEPTAHDELLFIVIHQTYELWFKQILFETESLVQNLLKDNLIFSFRLLDRISEIFRVLIQQVDVLETMSPVEFNEFRSKLNPASGFQSAQFRELEQLGGIDTTEPLKFVDVESGVKERVQNRLKGITLRSAFIQLLAHHGLLASRNPDDLKPALLAIYKDSRHGALHSLCERFIRFDEQFMLWRFRHVQMVERMIGMKRGTGGSLGVPYLQATLRKRFFPELWEIRTDMGGAYGAPAK